MKIELDKRFKDRLKGRFAQYDLEVGILEDGPHKAAKRGKRGLGGKDVLSSYAGGPIRKKSAFTDGLISDVSKENRQRLGFNYMTKPFSKKSSDIIKFTNEFFKYAFGRSEAKRLENLIQAIVRNPILRGEYGPTGPLTNKIKGFSRPMIDTAQLFKAITARVRKKRV